jgi:hypothetical protein
MKFSLEELKTHIDNYPKKHIDILQIIQTHNIPYTENKNGIFLNLSDMSPLILNKIATYVTYIQEQNNIIYNIETKQSECELLL